MEMQSGRLVECSVLYISLFASSEIYIQLCKKAIQGNAPPSPNPPHLDEP